MRRELVLNQVDDDRVEAASRAVIEVSDDVSLVEVGDERPGRVADDEERISPGVDGGAYGRR
jgi:hypothetical protein